MKKWFLKWLFDIDINGQVNIIYGDRDVIVIKLNTSMVPTEKVETYVNGIKMRVEAIYPNNKVMILPYGADVSIINYKE